MDPLSVTVSVATFLANCLTTVKSLSNLSSKYQHALVTISSIVSETTILGAYLAHVQQLLLMNAPGVADVGNAGVELRRTFDVALTACLITFSCLEEEVSRLAGRASDAAETDWKEAAKLVWKDALMSELLKQIHEQQTAMALLVQTLQMLQSLSASNHFLSENRTLLQDMVTRSRSLRTSSFPSLKVPESIFDGRPSGAFLDGSSTVGSAEFDFDDDVVNSTVYRRAMARVQRQQSLRKKVRSVVEGDLIDFTDVGSEDEYETAIESASKDLEELVPRSSVHRKSPTMETLTEEPSDSPVQESPRRVSHRSATSNPNFQARKPAPRAHLYPPMAKRITSPALNTIASNAATADTNSIKSVETRSIAGSSRAHSPATLTGESSSASQVVNFSRKPPTATGSSLRSDSMTGFYDGDDATSSIHPNEEIEREPARMFPITSILSKSTKRLDKQQQQQQQQQQRTGIPPKAARRLGVDERVHPNRLAHIEEMPHSDHSSRPNSRTSGSSADSKSKGKKSSLSSIVKPIESLAKAQPLDWSQPWVVFWRLTPSEIQKPPNGYSLGLQEMWWRLLQLEESYHQSLDMLHNLISSSDASLPTCGITPMSIRKLQACHDKHLRQPMRACMIGPWTFDYPAIMKSYQSAHAHVLPLYERYAWDLPLVTFQVAAAATGPTVSASRDLLSSIGPGMPTRYTCFRSPLTHICASFDTIQALFDGLHKGGPPSSPNYGQAVAPVREQLRSLVASCNRNILLRWDDLRRSNLFGSYPSRDIAHVMKELVFPPSQRRNIALLGLNSPTRAVISRADLHWKAKPNDSWSKCHAILLNNYLILASVSDTKGSRQHQVYHLISLKQIATTTMSPAETSDKERSKKTKAGKPIYHLYVLTPDFEHIIGFATLLHCLEWHEHLDVALRGEMMDMPTGISASAQ